MGYGAVTTYLAMYKLKHHNRIIIIIYLHFKHLLKEEKKS